MSAIAIRVGRAPLAATPSMLASLASVDERASLHASGWIDHDVALNLAQCTREDTMQGDRERDPRTG
jgi:hypothetical protein